MTPEGMMNGYYKLSDNMQLDSYVNIVDQIIEWVLMMPQGIMMYPAHSDNRVSSDDAPKHHDVPSTQRL